MKKCKITFLTSLVIAGMAASLMIQHNSLVAFREQDFVMRLQDQQLSVLTEEHQRLSSLSGLAYTVPPEDHTAELAKLRNMAEVLEKQTNDLGQQWEKNHVSQASINALNPEPHPPEYYKQLHQMAGSKESEAVHLGAAFLDYANDHQNQSPSNLDQLAPYLAKQYTPLSGSNQFEIIYQGSLENLKGIPTELVAVVREQQPWPGPDGKIMRIYGMMGGIGQAIESDDNFQSWESQHVFSSPLASQSGQ